MRTVTYSAARACVFLNLCLCLQTYPQCLSPRGPRPPLPSFWSRSDVSTGMTEPQHQSLRFPVSDKLLTCPQRLLATHQGMPLLPANSACQEPVGNKVFPVYTQSFLLFWLLSSPPAPPAILPTCTTSPPGEGMRRWAHLQVMGPLPAARPTRWTSVEAEGGGRMLKDLWVRRSLQPSCLFCVPCSCKCVIVSGAIYLC